LSGSSIGRTAGDDAFVLHAQNLASSAWIGCDKDAFRHRRCRANSRCVQVQGSVPVHGIVMVTSQLTWLSLRRVN
jgi:hypothetical protein